MNKKHSKKQETQVIKHVSDMQSGPSRTLKLEAIVSDGAEYYVMTSGHSIYRVKDTKTYDFNNYRDMTNPELYRGVTLQVAECVRSIVYEGE